MRTGGYGPGSPQDLVRRARPSANTRSRSDYAQLQCFDLQPHPCMASCTKRLCVDFTKADADQKEI